MHIIYINNIHILCKQPHRMNNKTFMIFLTFFLLIGEILVNDDMVNIYIQPFKHTRIGWYAVDV